MTSIRFITLRNSQHQQELNLKIYFLFFFIIILILLFVGFCEEISSVRLRRHLILLSNKTRLVERLKNSQNLYFKFEKETYLFVINFNYY